VAVIVGTFSLLLAGGGFIVPEDRALRISLDDTLNMMLRFDRLLMPDGRRSPIHPEIVELPSGEKVNVEGAIESGSRGRKSIEHTIVGTGAGALLDGIFWRGKGGRHFTAPPQRHRAGSPHPQTGAPQLQAAPVRSAAYRWRRA